MLQSSIPNSQVHDVLQPDPQKSLSDIIKLEYFFISQIVFRTDHSFTKKCILKHLSFLFSIKELLGKSTI